MSNDVNNIINNLCRGLYFELCLDTISSCERCPLRGHNDCSFYNCGKLLLLHLQDDCSEYHSDVKRFIINNMEKYESSNN